ncbi:glutathione S-transferase family protein [Pseudooceanicola sp. LIPI14-2-Ac024]|uniref:glutathione S-transferase family protein n=1 Tax=Pseudooceanicola sp. LIPI14-2-Ac024 TaxID=3344875 RepID=UPI0035CEA154
MYEVIGHGHTRAFRVLWMLEELGLEYTHRPDAPHSPLVREHSSLGKVPVMLVDGVALTDSTAIITYLADKHGKFTYAPGTLERARQDGFTNLALDELEGLLWTAARHSFILPKEERVAEIKPALKVEIARNAERLAGRIEGPYLMGEEMTIADIVATHCLNWAHSIKFLPENEVLAAYGKRMRARPAFRKVAEMAAA